MQRGFAHHLVNERFGNRLLGERQLHQLVAVVVERFEQPLAPKLGLSHQIRIGNLRRDNFGAFLALGKRQQLHPHEIDDAAKRIRRMGRPLADGNLQRDRARTESVADFLEHGLEVGPLAVHLVDERQPRHMIFVGLPPNRFALRLDALAGAEHHDAAIEHPQAALDLGREIDVPRRIDQVDDDIFPGKLHAGRVDRDAALGFLRIIVRGGGAHIDGAGAVLRAAAEQHPLGDGGLAGIDVGDDADVPDAFEGYGHLCCQRIKNAAAFESRGVLMIGITTRSARTPCWRRPCGGRFRGGSRRRLRG